jgi:hypothetical protein
MEKIIDRILNSEKLSPKEFNSFCKKNSIDKSNRSNFKDSLTKAIERLTSERDKIFIPNSQIIKGDNPITQWGEFYSKNRKTERVFPPGTDKKKVSSDKKRKKELSEDISLIDEMLQIVDLYSEKESSQIKENNSPGLMDFEEPLKSKLDKINSYLITAKKGNVSEREIKNRVKIKVRKIWKDEFESIYFTKTFSNRENFIRMIYPSLELNFPFDWDIEAYVKTLSNN